MESSYQMLFYKDPKWKTNKNKISLDEREVWGDSEGSSGVLVLGKAREKRVGKSLSWWKRRKLGSTEVMLFAPKPHGGVVAEPRLESRATNSGSNSRAACLPLAMCSTGELALTDKTNLRQLRRREYPDDFFHLPRFRRLFFFWPREELLMRPVGIHEKKISDSASALLGT